MLSMSYGCDMAAGALDGKTSSLIRENGGVLGVEKGVGFRCFLKRFR